MTERREIGLLGIEFSFSPPHRKAFPMKSSDKEKTTPAKKTLAVGLAVLGLAGTASAFPTWMGVYGAYQTHDGANPGTCT